MLNWLKRLIAGKELAELERYRLGIQEAYRWFAIQSYSPEAKTAVDYIERRGLGQDYIHEAETIRRQIHHYRESLPPFEIQTRLPFEPYTFGDGSKWESTPTGEVYRTVSGDDCVLCCGVMVGNNLFRDEDLAPVVAEKLNIGECAPDLIYFLSRFIRRTRHLTGTWSSLSKDVLQYLERNNLLTYTRSLDLGANYLNEKPVSSQFFTSYHIDLTKMQATKGMYK